MVANRIIWNIVRLLLWTGCLVLLFFSVYSVNADSHAKARSLNDGQMEFRPNRAALFGWLLIACYFAYATTVHLMRRHNYRNPLETVISCCVALVPLTIMFSLPGTIIVTAEGVHQYFWIRKAKRIRWEDIVEINTGEKSLAVTITAGNRTKIVHTSQLADRTRFLMEIKKHCGENLPPDFPRESISGSQ
jgi:hypothetical protein